MTNQITHEQIKETETYKQAARVAELVVIPDLSDDALNYFELLNDYRETTRELNSSGFGRFETVSQYHYDPDLTEFAKNVEVFAQMESNITRAKELHALIIQSVAKGLHKQALEEMEERYRIQTGKREIYRNAYQVAQTYLEEQAKEQAKREKARAKEQRETILKAQ